MTKLKMSSQAKPSWKRKINADIRSFLTSPPPPSEGLQNPSAHEDLEHNHALVAKEEEEQIMLSNIETIQYESTLTLL